MSTEQQRAHALQYEWIPEPGRSWVCLRPIGEEKLVYEPVEVAYAGLRALETEAGYDPEDEE